MVSPLRAIPSAPANEEEFSIERRKRITLRRLERARLLKESLGRKSVSFFDTELGTIIVSALPAHLNPMHGFVVEVQESTTVSTWLEFKHDGKLTFSQWEQREPEKFVGEVSAKRVKAILEALSASAS